MMAWLALAAVVMIGMVSMVSKVSLKDTEEAQGNSAESSTISKEHAKDDAENVKNGAKYRPDNTLRLRASNEFSLETSPLNRCAWIQSLLDRKEELSVGPPLPEPGVSRGSVTFWLKRPVLHAIDPETGAEIVVLLYNIYSTAKDWTQHTEKFNNTVKVLHQKQGDEIFPKLHGFCKDIGGFHYIVVEFIDYDIDALPKPTSFEQCAKRATDLFDLFVKLDEEHHLYLSDLKPGQWMARKDYSLVMQDVDDILEPGRPFVYPEQVEWLQGRMMGHLGISEEVMQSAWNREMFPHGKGSIRYDVVNTALMLDNLGFRWSSNCPGGKVSLETFEECREKLILWSMSLTDDWPSPRQVRDAFLSCTETGTFSKSPRPPAPWRDIAEPDSAWVYVPKSACFRPYDDSSKTPSRRLKFCHRGDVKSCCRSKGSQDCYYEAPNELCRLKKTTT